MSQLTPHRAFKSAWFTKAAQKARISDEQLCHSIQQVIKRQADDLGGGVFKKRVNDNMHRSIILARAGQWWVYQYLFAKKDRDNIDDAEQKHSASWLRLMQISRLPDSINWFMTRN